MAKKAANHTRPRAKRTKAKAKTMGAKKGKAASFQEQVGNPQYKWLFMVYMQAGDTSNLDSLAVQDLIELQEGVQGSKDPEGKKDGRVQGNPNVVVFVQMQRKWPDLPQWYFIGPGESVDNIGAATYKDVATPESLKEFLDKGRQLGDKSGVTHYCLVLWGHNFGLGFGRDHDDALTIKELAQALALHAKGQWLDLLATNSCTMAYVEAAFQLKASVQYLVASQVFMPPKGFPYSSIVRSVGPDTMPTVLGKTFVDEYVKSFATSPNGEKVAMSLLASQPGPENIQEPAAGHC